MKQNKPTPINTAQLCIIWGLTLTAVIITVVATYVEPSFKGYIAAGTINSTIFFLLLFALPRSKNGALKTVSKLPLMYNHAVLICLLALLINFISIMGNVMPALF